MTLLYYLASYCLVSGPQENIICATTLSSLSGPQENIIYTTTLPFLAGLALKKTSSMESSVNFIIWSALIVLMLPFFRTETFWILPCAPFIE